MFKIKMTPALCQYACSDDHAVCPPCARRQVKEPRAKNG
jgi:hypothetical protein